jgi:site-specific recombinase XerD
MCGPTGGTLLRRNHDAELPCDLLDEQQIDLAGGSRKPSPVAEERQQHRETEPVAIVLGHDERQIRRRQCRSLQGRSFVDRFQFWADLLPRWVRLFFTKPAFCQKSNRGYDLRLIQDYLGHRDPKHTVHYTRTAASRFEGLWR